MFNPLPPDPACHQDSAIALEIGAERVGVVGPVGEQFGDTIDQADAGFRQHAVGHVARGQDQDPGAAEPIDSRMDFTVAAAFGDADRLRLAPPFPPPAQRWTFTWLASSAI